MPNPPKEHRFKEGQSGNPNGRPKGISLTTILKKYLNKEIDFTDPIEAKKVKKRIGDVIILKLLANAIKGDDRAIKEILERVDGKITQPLQNLGEGTKIIVVHDRNSIQSNKEADRSTPASNRLSE